MPPACVQSIGVAYSILDQSKVFIAMRTLFMLRLMIIIFTHQTLYSSEKSIPDDMDVHGAPNLYALYYTGSVYMTYFLLHMQVDAKKFVIQLQ